MRISKNWMKVACGAAVATAAVVALPARTAMAGKGSHQKGNGALKITDVDVGDFAGIPQNHIINMTFTQPIDPSSVSPATIQIRAQNATQRGFTIQVPGSFQVTGSLVRFYPRLPTNLRDPNDVNGGFYQVGTPQDNADKNAGFQPAKLHQITIVGSPNLSPIRSLSGRRLDRNFSKKFTTSPETPATEAFTTETYQDFPYSPRFEFSNPPDKVASPADQYARHGGQQDVPSAIAVTLFGNKIPLSPATVRQQGNVALTLLSRKGDTSLRKPIQGTTYLEQNFDTTRIVNQPRFPLPDVSTFALTVSNSVKDLTEVFQFEANSQRLRLRDIYEFLVTARSLAPQGTPPEQFQDPGDELIKTGDPLVDWPSGTTPEAIAARGVLKRNVLALGDTYKDEVDPRVMVLFSTQDEPVSHARVVINFLTSEGYFDSSRSTAEWDQGIPGAASGVFTFAGGSGINGDFTPASNTTISADSFPLNTSNWRKVNVPPNVIVTVTGTKPFTLKALTFQLDGEIRVNGANGNAPSSSISYTQIYSSSTAVTGGNGGPGGGKGGGNNPGTDTLSDPGGSGIVGNDSNGILASTQAGGRGGVGGTTATGQYYSHGGGGGGGGSRTAGTSGTAGTSPYGSWNGQGGAGGAAALGNDTLSPLVGGAGGGAGGHGGYKYPSYLWGSGGGGGGGGGGAIMIQTASSTTIGISGAVRAKGGSGGTGSGYKSGWSAGPGGGAGGGSILLRSSKGFNIANPAAALDVSGGAPGTQTGSYTAPSGGTGGAGFIRLEDPNGGISVPGGTSGAYSPVGAGVPSYVYSQWVDVGVDNPKLTNFKAGDFSLNAGNDAILIEMQAAIEDTKAFGKPKLTAVDASENSTNTTEVSQWMPIRLVDNTPLGNAFNVPANTNKLTDAIFPIEPTTAGKNYKFFRIRITFQLDPTQTASSSVPFVDQLVVNFDFNF